MEAILHKEVITDRAICRLLGAAAFVFLTALGAFVRIPLPFSPVPLTLQTFFVLLSAALLGRRLGSISQLIYISLGVAGVPLFTLSGSGLFYLAGPTGGYLVGFVLAAFFTGSFLKYAGNRFLSCFILFCIADALLLACGLLWLKVLFGYPFKKLMLIGALPFIPGDLLKAFLVTVIYVKALPRLKEIF